MKTKVIFLILTALLAFSLIGYAQNKKSNNKEEVVFDVSMTCENCKKKIEKNIAFEKGVSDMKVNLDNKTVKIVYQSNKTDQSKLQQALEKLGYTATIHLPDTNTNKE